MPKRSRTPSLDPESRSRPPDSDSSATPSSERAKINRDSLSLPVSEVMHCSLPPHHQTLSFASYGDYEVHYRQDHVNRCLQCSKNFPTNHYLNLHIEENHDPLIVARRERGDKTYGCFVETCDRKCSTPQKRRLHLIDKHMFPKTYNFFIINDGLDKQTSMLRPMNSHRRRLSSTHTGRLRRRSSAGQSKTPVSGTHEPATQVDALKNHTEDMEIDSLERSMSALRFVPASVALNRVKMGDKATS
ncbi:hypothetical protein N7492_000360 [Penicillium capsulatum]|uniref:C2H2-type domain-containing protein n=1 Tax=Penicillium capsulatum TaxID=69766 RepID=A0A9W9IPF3_9EURO|nr:hypothetical protein N7492_000360 [Penicillium capsulatum]KAJ6130576.1 hypothetical protein N7512_003356 [Penicillium capsulatum]